MTMEDIQLMRIKGRGTASNPPNRFNKFHIERDPGCPIGRETEFYLDHSRSPFSRNSSPDLPFTFSLNPYRGCEHGCIYCYARPSHEYLGFSSGLDFETKILVKKDVPGLMAEEFERQRWSPQTVVLSGNTDPYQPVESKLRLTRACLDVFLRYRNPVGIITKNYRITKDLDLLAEMAKLNLVSVAVSITSLDDKLIGKLEPRTSRPARRLRAIEKLSSAGVPVSVFVAPVIPGLTDEEMPAILKAAVASGATSAAYMLLRLPLSVEILFREWLQMHYPEREKKVLGRLRSMRGGELTDSRFGVRMRGEGVWADVLNRLFKLSVQKLHLNEERIALNTSLFRRIRNGQISLFDESV